MKGKYIIINGPAGIGKSTIARCLKEKLSRSYKVAHIQPDYLRAITSEKEPTKENRNLALKNSISLTINFLKEGYTVILDGVFYKFDKQILIEKLKEFYGCAFFISGPLDLCLERNSKRGNKKRLPKKKVKKLYELVYSSKLDWEIEIDGSQSIESIVNDVIYHLKDGLNNFE